MIELGPIEAAFRDGIIAARSRMGMAPPEPRLPHKIVIDRLRARVSALEGQVTDLSAANNKLEIQISRWARRPQKIITMIGAAPGTPVSRSRWRIIVDQVALKHGVTTNDIRSSRRGAQLVPARHEAFFRLRNETTMSMPQIGRLMGNKDHTTVLNGIQRHEQRVEAGEAL